MTLAALSARSREFSPMQTASKIHVASAMHPTTTAGCIFLRRVGGSVIPA